MKVRMSVEQQNKDTFIGLVRDKYHFGEKDTEVLEDVYGELQKSVEPYAMYRINQKVTGVAAIDEGPAAVVAMTLGIGVDRQKEAYIGAGRLSEAYMLDCLANELLLKLYAEFNAAYARFHRRYVKRYIFIGDEIPVTVIPSLLTDIRGNKQQAERRENTQKSGKEEKSAADAGEEKTESMETAEETVELPRGVQKEQGEITANEYGVLFPSKSVVFYAALSENPNQACEGICRGCSNPDCEYHADPSDKRQNLNYGYQRIFGT